LNTFNTPNSKYLWDTIDDQSYGGKSNGEVDFDHEAKAVSFAGYINEDNDGLMEKNPSLKFSYRLPFPISIAHFNRFRIEA
jgi:hypothetical protein